MNNGHNPPEGQPHLDIVVQFYPTMSRVNIQVPGELQPFMVLGLLEQAKAEYWAAVKAKQADSRIVPVGAFPNMKAS